MIDFEVLNRVAIPPRWNDDLYHVGSSFTVNSILPCGKDTKEGRHTVFFTLLDPAADDTEEEHDESKKPRKVHYKNKWTFSLDAICWVNLGKAQDKGLQFWQTRSRAIILHDSVPVDCIQKW